MEDNVVTISLERYAELVIAEKKIGMLKSVIAENSGSYGHDEKTANKIEAVLEVSGK